MKQLISAVMKSVLVASVVAISTHASADLATNPGEPTPMPAYYIESVNVLFSVDNGLIMTTWSVGTLR